MNVDSPLIAQLQQALARAMPEPADNMVRLPALILPTVELCEVLQMPSSLISQAESQTVISSYSLTVANGAASGPTMFTFGKGLYEIFVQSDYSANYNSAGFGATSPDLQMFFRNPASTLTRNLYSTWAQLNVPQTRSWRGVVLLAEPGFSLAQRLETNGVGQQHSVITSLYSRRLIG
jgi:hypothetical protein